MDGHRRASLAASRRTNWATHLALLLVATGLAILVAGFVYDVAFAGIPYQDPTPGMVADYARHARVASLIRWVGFLVALAGAAAGFARRRARRAR